MISHCKPLFQIFILLFHITFPLLPFFVFLLFFSVFPLLSSSSLLNVSSSSLISLSSSSLQSLSSSSLYNLSSSSLSNLSFYSFLNYPFPFISLFLRFYKVSLLLFSNILSLFLVFSLDFTKSLLFFRS